MNIKKTQIYGVQKCLVPAANKKAKDIYQKAKNAEPEITKDIIDLGNKHGGTVEGLKFKLKEEESIARKLVVSGIEFEINDALRYTIIFDEESIAAGSINVMKELERRGYSKSRVSNTFKKGVSYKGINTTFKSKDGQIMELQFHTPKSFDIKQNVNHSIYEEQRLLDKNDPRFRELRQVMTKNSSEIPIPKDIEKVK